MSPSERGGTTVAGHDIHEINERFGTLTAKVDALRRFL
jgi:hypothetical protein